MIEPAATSGPGSSAPSTADGVTAALLAVAAAENAAIFGYSVAGARLSAAGERTVARSYYDVHRAQLVAVTSWLADRGATPAQAAPAYTLPYPVTDATSAKSLLTSLEEAAAATYADVVALTGGPLQHAAALALQSAAIREAHWRGGSVAFPGLLGRLPG